MLVPSMSECEDLWRSPPPLTANPDVSGIGVVIAFIASAYITLVLLIVHYVLVFDPHTDNFNTQKENCRPNQIDVSARGLISRRIMLPSGRWEAGLEKLILSLSDQQMITGVALLASSFQQLRGGISAYHWQISVYLVWFSSVTHLTTLTVLRRYLAQNHPMRWWRLIIIGLIAFRNVIALLPTGNSLWLLNTRPLDMEVLQNQHYTFVTGYLGMPAICIYRTSIKGTPTGSDDHLATMCFAIAVLLISYTIKAIKLFRFSTDMVRTYLRGVPSQAIRRYLSILHTGMCAVEWNKWMFAIPYWVLIAVYVSVKVFFDIMNSMLWEIVWLVLSLVWATLRLMVTRNYLHSGVSHGPGGNAPSEVRTKENTWTFGQFLIVAMLALNVLNAIEAYHDSHKYHKTKLQTTESTVIHTVALNNIASGRESSSLTGNMGNQPPEGIANYTTRQIMNGRANLLTLGPQRIGSTVAPHDSNFYVQEWFLPLIGLTFLQILSLSIFGLIKFSKTIGNPLDFFYQQFSWLTVYSPLSTVIFSLGCLMCYVGPFADISTSTLSPTFSALTSFQKWCQTYSLSISWAFAFIFATNSALLLWGIFPQYWEYHFRVPRPWLYYLPWRFSFAIYMAILILIFTIPWMLIVNIRLWSLKRATHTLADDNS